MEKKWLNKNELKEYVGFSMYVLKLKWTFYKRVFIY